MRGKLAAALVAVMLAGPGPSQAVDLPKATPEGQKALDALFKACLQDGGLKIVKESGKTVVLIDEKKLHATLAARKDRLTAGVLDALIVAGFRVIPEVRPMVIALLEGFGRTAKDHRAFGVAAYLTAQMKERARDTLAADKAYEEADKHFDSGKEPGWRALSLNERGLLQQSLGEYGRAETLFNQALALYQELYPKSRHPQGHPYLAATLNNLGVLYHDQGEYTKAAPFLQQTLERRKALYPRKLYPQGHTELAASLSNLGGLYRSQGEYARAEELSQQALEMRQRLYPKMSHPQGHLDLARSLNNLGLLYQLQKEFTKAEPLLDQALKMRRSLYPKKDYPHGHRDLATSLTNLGGLYEEMGKGPKAETYHKQALEMFQALYPKSSHPRGHPLLAHCLNNLGCLYHFQGKDDSAEGFFQQALEMYQALYPQGHRDLASCLSNLGSLHRSRGEYARAESVLKKSLAMFQQHSARLALTAPESQALNCAATFPLVLDNLLTVTRQRKAKPESTYRMTWQSKANLTRVYERRHLQVLAGLSSPQVKRLWDPLVSLRRQRERLLLAPLLAHPRQRDEQLAKIDESIAGLEKDLRPLLPAVPRAEMLARAGPEELQKALPDGAVFIDLVRYVFFERDGKKRGGEGEKRTDCFAAFVVTRDSIRRVELGPARDIEKAIDEWRQSITAWRPGRPDAVRQATRLRELLWSKLEDHLPEKSAVLYLCPDGELARVPWVALPGRKSGRLLLEEHALAVVPHGVFLLDRLTAAAEKEKARSAVLALGGVRYDRKPSKDAPNRGVAARMAGADKLSWDFLPGSQEELQQVVKQAAGVKVRTLRGDQASRSAVLESLPACSHAHLATHGFFATKEFRSLLQLDEKLFARRHFPNGFIGERIGAGARSPLVLSGLVLAGANLPETPDRGILSADAIVSLPLHRLQLAVLSACETGLGDVAGGEGVFGLQRAFHLAGTRDVIASLWKVDDAATTALMVLFYRNLWQEKLPPIEALRRAQLALYYHPEAVKDWAQAKRGPNLSKTFKGSAIAPPAKEVKGRSPSHWWAAFVLSGPGDHAPAANRSETK